VINYFVKFSLKIVEFILFLIISLLVGTLYVLRTYSVPMIYAFYTKQSGQNTRYKQMIRSG